MQTLILSLISVTTNGVPESETKSTSGQEQKKNKLVYVLNFNN